MSLPTNEDFANEVKTDRLTILYQATLAITIILLIFMSTFATAFKELAHFFIMTCAALAAIIVGSVLTRLLLKRERLEGAVWTYALGGVAGVTIMLRLDMTAVVQIVPFVFPVIIFIVGLLLRPAHTFVMVGICVLLTLFAPLNAPALGVYQLTAIVLMLLSAAFSAQVTGELYQVTEWALQNYQRERRTNDELFEKRLELQKSLKRSEALSMKLQEINQELEAANAAAEEAKKFRGQFLANMSHELRTPLNAIIGFSETMIKFPMMYDDQTLPQPYEKDVNQIYSSGRQLLFVINDILDLAKVDAGKLEIHMQRVELEPIVSATLTTAKGLLGSKKVTLKRNTPETLSDVYADESRLRQVLLNIYSNAVKYTDEGEIELKIEEKDAEVQFSIRDTGVGIDKQYHEVIFEEFKQARSGGRDPRAGTGLGLTISKQLLDLMQGRIWVESEPGKGSTFFFVLARYADQDKVAVHTPEQTSTDMKKVADTPQIVEKETVSSSGGV